MAQILAPFPRELNVKLDNTSKDNKNCFFDFCNYMVHNCLYDRVVVNVWPGMNTYEDTDLRFRRSSVFMQDRNTTWVLNLHKHILEIPGGSSSSVQTTLHASLISAMKNFSGASEEQDTVKSKINDLRSFRKFVFQRDDSCKGPATQDFVTYLTGYEMVQKR